MGQVGLLGLGAMGSAVARRLTAAGFVVIGYDIDPDRRAALEDIGGRPVPSVGDVAEATAIVLTLLPTAAALEATTTAIAEATRRDAVDATVVAELSTFALSTKGAARDRLAAAGVRMIDGALSGTALQAQRGDVVVYASGDTADIDRCQPAFDALGRATYRLGGFGAATRTKLIANHLVAIHIAAAAEALSLARRAGLDLRTTLAAVADGAGTSRMLEVRGPLMIDRAFSPPSTRMDVFLKDVSLIDEFARGLDLPTEVFDTAASLFRAALAAGRADEDSAAIYAWLEARNAPDGSAEESG